MATVEARPFGVRFDEAIRYLQGKLPEASLAWDDLAGVVHSKVFTVAGATTTDLARDMQQAIVEAKANGSSISDFRKDFDAVVQKHGWTYNGKRGWRTRVIYDTNMRSAAMAGRWEQLVANAERRPFLQYRTAGDARVRPQHRAWNGQVHAIGSAFWDTHYPPNGWGCRCTVRAYSQSDLDAKGLQASQPAEIRTRTVLDRNGDVVDQVPVGIDRGWDHNVGKAWISPTVALGEKLARLPRELQGLLVDKTISPAFQQAISAEWKAFRQGVEDTRQPRGETQIVGFLDSATLDGLARVAPALQLESTAVGVLDARTGHLAGAHKATSNPLQVWPAGWIDELPMHLRDYQAVLWDRQGDVLVLVPRGSFAGVPGHTLGERPAKVVLRPNVATKHGPMWSVVSLGSAEWQNLAEGRYQLLVGRVK
jgi:SPP1 gp7 family putative phage head morphogenesis protein